MRRKFKKKSVFIKTFAFIVFIFLLVFLILKVGLFNINRVDVISKDLGCAGNDQVRNSLQIEGKNIFTLNNQELIKSIKQKFVCVKSVTIKPSYPNKIN